METYGNVLYEFCFYRRRLRDFHIRQLWKRKVFKFQRYIYDVSRCIARNDELPLNQEFYRIQNYRKFQKDTLKVVGNVILQDI